ncbi:hypothetical protein F5B22DRAFT_646385 [Xylaria bambusicola]|uniref:uncharacterized protein n=1 Tax=Xylaria bambusicola TaxID=326684 RepID=UPI00200741C5|nr:uncharacterized protein F5B22DRAFT_646385 [Xylaria bambusicola]KAI0517031.1 hypothetical protein F5B22DRAFT_646385 [Xylaria bambusicola]
MLQKIFLVLLVGLFSIVTSLPVEAPEPSDGNPIYQKIIPKEKVVAEADEAA